MTEKRWTPGEWQAVDNVVCALNTQGTNRFYVGVQHGFDDNNQRISRDEALANAQIMGAAPLMYEALEALHHAVTSVRCRNLRQCVVAADIALRTARGEIQEQQA